MDFSTESLSVLTTSNTTSPAVLLTPGRTRNIAQDMEALRLSRQDNPYLQQVMASRESLIESHMDACESDDAVLMTQEFGSASLDLIEDDPLTLKEVHDHMIRSPPPIACWPHESLSFRASSAFDFSGDGSVSYSAYSVNSDQEKELLPATALMRNSPLRLAGQLHHSTEDYQESTADARTNSRNNNQVGGRRSSSRSISPRARNHNAGGTRPLSLPGESHIKNVLSRNKLNSQHHDRFSLLHNPIPLRPRTCVKHSRDCEDSVQLVQNIDK